MYMCGKIAILLTVCAFMLIAHCCRPELFGINAGYYLSGDNAITEFKGATTNNDGFIGYIPAPRAGQHNYVLTGSGLWTKIGLGLTGEKWNNVRENRTVGKIYKNDKPYPIGVNIYVNSSSQAQTASLSVDGVQVAGFVASVNTGAISSNGTLSATIPINSSYMLAGIPDANIGSWVELY